MNTTITHKHLRNILDNLSEDNFDDMLVELQFSTLIVPVNDMEGVPIIDFDGKKFIPLFTDIYEMNKFDAKNEFRPVDHEFNFYLELLIDKSAPGFMINPDSERFPVTYEFLNVMEPNYILEQDYHPFTVNEIRKIKNSICNRELDDFLNDKSNSWDLDELVNKLSRSDILTLLMSHDNFTDSAEDEVITLSQVGGIPKCLYGIGGKNYVLLFSHDLKEDPLNDSSVFKYTRFVNFPLLVEEALQFDFDGFILNIDTDSIVIPRESLRNFMKGFNCPVINDFSMYAFTIEG
ncbi:MAG: SseB family protein [Methanobrevibacter sp.]|uniref:SseB family protein n=1 Tax=Methanobrevibacter sp. TaxID=66852 RepID=UPI0025DC12EF|nr:SseB family protein [Methanobrevibacter sp.]MBE6507912.1 SseB family protein [Methanobrevibacter sp.]